MHAQCWLISTATDACPPFPRVNHSGMRIYSRSPSSTNNSFDRVLSGGLSGPMSGSLAAAAAAAGQAGQHAHPHGASPPAHAQGLLSGSRRERPLSAQSNTHPELMAK